MTGRFGSFADGMKALCLAIGLAVLPLAPAHAQSQMQTIDPNSAIDADIGAPPVQSQLPPVEPMPQSTAGTGTAGADYADPNGGYDPTMQVPTSSEAASGATYQRDDLIGAAEGVFGKGAEGLARMIEDILKDQGEPNGYIVGREAGGAFVVGLRYGSGTLYHKVEGQKQVYWTGPSVGFDAGANAGNSFVLVYNLHDTEDLYKRFGAGEGAAYLVGGFNASYLRRGDVVLIPIRLGVGLRLGANVGYMKFSKKQRWLPF